MPDSAGRLAASGEIKHMSSKVKPIPEGYHNLTPYLIVKGLSKAIEFYKNAFSAVERETYQGPDGKVYRAELQFGDSILMLAEEYPENGAFSPISAKPSDYALYFYVSDVDSAYAKAIKAGAKQKTPITDQFWGDRYGQIVDPFGYTWALATHFEDVSKEDRKKRMEEQFAAATK